MKSETREELIEVMARAIASWEYEPKTWSYLDPTEQQFAFGSAKEALAAIESAGFRVVPYEPTFDIVSAGGAAVWDKAGENRHKCMELAYRAMLDAANDGE